MRSEESIRQYMISSKMIKSSSWATELEIFATSDLLKVNIFTYSNLRWLQFSLEELNPELMNEKEAIYLYHKHQNHYDVVLNVSDKRFNANSFDNQKRSLRNAYYLRKKK